MNQITYHADLYLRLSKEDGDKEESDSIVNQKELLKEFLKSKPEIRIHKVRIDDGYTGVNFERPSFQEMLKDIKSGKVNCVIVKDLSRFGRNYIEVGKYIEKIFPYLNVRFIAINDHYDSGGVQNQSDHIVIPFKNLMNDSYSRDISVKIRSQLEIKRKKGQYVGAFAPYGYQKSFQGKNQLVVDEFAAEIVKLIFKMRLCGSSIGKIVEHLNELGVLPPMEYKRSKGSRYKTGFKRKSESGWTPVGVNRILKNEVYIGVMEQGKRTTPNYKMKQRVNKEKEDWIRVESVHEAIITDADFNAVQRLAAMDTRISPTKDHVYCLSGLIKCGDCKGNMVRKTVTSGKNKYIYYVCGNHKYHKKCSLHNTNARKLENCVLSVINMHIEQMIHIEEMFHSMEQFPSRSYEIKRQEMLLQSKKTEIEKYRTLTLTLYEDMKEGVINSDEYQELKKLYSSKVEDAEKSKKIILQEITELMNNNTTSGDWVTLFKKSGHVDTLKREMVVVLIDEILIFEGGRIEITFQYPQEYKDALQYI